MFRLFFTVMALAICSMSTIVHGQDEMKHLRADVGTWDAEIKFFGNPNSPPEVSKGTETNFMLGDYWLISHFKGTIMGMEFQGSSQTGYDPAKKKYVGAWVDSLSPYPMHLEGTWDEATKTMTSHAVGKDPLGNETKSKMVVVYNGDGSRTFTMYAIADGHEQKMMEVRYTKAKSGDGAK